MLFPLYEVFVFCYNAVALTGTGAGKRLQRAGEDGSPAAAAAAGSPPSMGQSPTGVPVTGQKEDAETHQFGWYRGLSVPWDGQAFYC